MDENGGWWGMEFNRRDWMKGCLRGIGSKFREEGGIGRVVIDALVKFVYCLNYFSDK